MKSFKIDPHAERNIAKMARRERDRKAAEALARAQADAPVITGAYRDHLHIESDENETRLSTGVDYGLLVEARHHVLARAMSSVRE